MIMKLAPSLFGADLFDLSGEIQLLEHCGVDMLHIDMMDGNFVPNIAFGPDQIHMLRAKTRFFFDVHMMVVEPERYIQRVAAAGADMITVHVEATHHVDRCIQMIKECGKQAGIVLNPGTPLSTVQEILDDIDMMLLMTVNPGYGGQSFMPKMLRKIKDAREMIGARNIDLEVDGGVNDLLLKQCRQAGANVFVAGSFAFKGNVKENINKLNNAMLV
jgi:ribulose-phosphate 3-epimerase